MGIYGEYLDQGQALDLNAERKKQLARIAQLRGRDVLVYASDSNKPPPTPIALDNSDLLPITDQLSNLNNRSIDIILETGGGRGETAEDVVRFLHQKYDSVAFIIPGMAKSAGTIMVMAGDEILMEPGSSSLGPIDAQIQWEGKIFSAEAFLKGLENIKAEVATTNSLNRAYIPILQRISPGEIQNAENALSFAKVLVTKWLKEHKFKNWSMHRTHSPGTLVTEIEKEARLKEIADKLCDHSKWLSHGRSIKMPDLQALGLEITDYSVEPELSDAIKRYHVLLRMTFDTTNIYKLFETPTSQIFRFFNQQVQFAMPPGSPPPPRIGAPGVPAAVDGALVAFQCPNCKKQYTLQADFDKQRPSQPGTHRFPPNDILVCDQCHVSHNLLALRRQLGCRRKGR